MSELNVRARSWCFTLNNWTPEEYASIFDWDVKFLVVGKEVGDEEGTPHLQGYVEWKNAKTLRQCKAKNDRAHWEIREATAKQAADYCRKDGDFEEKGEESQQGARTDLHELVDRIMGGETAEEVILSNPRRAWLYQTHIQRLAGMRMQHRTNKPKIVWLWGPSGVGKTRMVMTEHQSVYIKDGTRWWDGYTQQEAILLDDFDGNNVNYRDFLRLLDRNPYRGETKGSYVPINSPYIYITCEHHPSEYWKDNELHQVMRRLDHCYLIHHYDDDGCHYTEDTEVGQGNTAAWPAAAAAAAAVQVD